MKRYIVKSFLCFIFISLTTQVAGQNLSEKQRALIEKEVDSVFHLMVKAAENLDFDKLAQGVYDLNQAGFISNGTYYPQFDSLLVSSKAKSQGVSKQKIAFSKKKITILSADLALITAFGNSEVETNSGSTFNTKFYWSFVFQKIDGIWKVIQSHQSSPR